MMWDQYQRHFGPRTAYFPYAESRVPILLADGSTLVHTTGATLGSPLAAYDTNPGFNPLFPTSPTPTQYVYQPNPAWEPPVLQGQGAGVQVRGIYRYTRSGLRGRDFSGPEVPWVP